MARNDKDWATGKPVDFSKPEEKVRQDYERVLHFDYDYPVACMDIEVKIKRGSVGREKADLVLYATTEESKRDQNKDIVGIVETKRKERSDGVDQLMSYMTATSCQWGVWTNGEEIEFLYKDPQTGTVEPNIIFGTPHYGNDPDTIGTHTYSDLKSASNLKITFRRLLNELYTNTNISRREKLGNEMIKLLFCKLQDEKVITPSSIPRFRVGLKDHENGFVSVRQRIDDLFEDVKGELAGEGVFDENEKVVLEDRSVAYVVGELQEYSLSQTDEDAVGSAFEVFAESKFAGEKGEFFTPREIVKTAIQIISPQPGETIMDPACGSGGFLIGALQHIWGLMDSHPTWNNLSSQKLVEVKCRIAKQTIHGLDKESDLVKITKAYMAIIGDGKSRIAQANSLHPPERFEGTSRTVALSDDPQDGFRQFDVILTNPPFGSKNTKVSLTESATFDLGHKWKKNRKGTFDKQDEARSTPAQELFIERCLDLLKPGGRLAIILPETIAHAPTKKHIVQYIKSRGNIRCVIDLPHNTFRPHCNAKTLLWIIEKDRNQDDIVFGVAREMGRDHLGKEKYRVVDGKITNEVWDDTIAIRKELEKPEYQTNRHVFVVQDSVIRKNIYVPRYYWETVDEEIREEAEKQGLQLVKMGYLIEKSIVRKFKGHGSPPNEYKGLGNVPYVRAGDIGNLAVYKNPTSGVPEHIYREVKGERGVDLQSGDLVFVKEGSYRIGDVGLILPGDTEILLNSHCLVFRVINEDNSFGIDPMYLAYLLSHPLTRRQIYSKVFIDTTLPNIGDRWLDLELPIHTDENEILRIKTEMDSVFRKRHEAEDMLTSLLDKSRYGIRQTTPTK